MNKQRLEMMATMLHEVERKTWKATADVCVVASMFGLGVDVDHIAFDLGEWLAPEDEPEEGHTCGYSACAVGHAVLDKRFVDDGLHLGDFGAPTYSTTMGWGAVREYFDIKIKDAWFLFDSTEYDGGEPTPAEVADRIRAFIVNAEAMREE